MFSSLQNTLLAWFLSFSLVTIILIVPFSLYHYSKKEKVSNVVKEIDQLHILILKTNEIQNRFFSYETINSDYFRTGKSNYLSEHELISEQSQEIFRELESDIDKQRYGLNQNLIEIQATYTNYIRLFDTIVTNLFKRGFKDFGLEGQMRDNIHLLEDFENISQKTILSLRRHEKDYIIRNEDEYILKHKELANKFRNQLRASASLNKNEKDSVLSCLNKYINYFNQLVELDKKIGIKDNTGFKLELDQSAKKLEKQIAEFQLHALEMKRKLFNRLEITYLIFSFLVVILSIIVSLKVSKSLVTPFATLSDYLKKLIASDFKKKERIIVSSKTIEIQELYDEFNSMIKHLLMREKERDKAEYDLRESEMRFRQLIKILPICVYEADENDQLHFVNNAFVETFKYSKSDVIKGVNLIHLVTENDRDKLFFSESVLKNEIIARNKNGDLFPALIYASHISVDGEIKGSRGVIIDVSDRLLELKKLSKKTKEALENGGK
jgi:adenylate cyclase